MFYPNCIKVNRGGRVYLGLRTLNGATLKSASLSNVRVRLLRPGDGYDTTAPLMDWGTASIISTGELDGTIYIDVPASLAGTLGENHRAEFEYTASGLTHYADTLWHVVTTVIDKTVTAVDLDRELTTLSQYSTITEAMKNHHIDSAFASVFSMLKSKARFPWLIFNADDVNESVKRLALAKLCLSQAREDDVWAFKYNEYLKSFHAHFDNMVFTYAETIGGTPDRTSNPITFEVIR